MCDIALWKRWGLLVAAAFWRTFQRRTKRNLPLRKSQRRCRESCGSEMSAHYKGKPWSKVRPAVYAPVGDGTPHILAMATFFKAANEHKTLYHARRHDWSHVSIKNNMGYKQRRWTEVMRGALNFLRWHQWARQETHLGVNTPANSPSLTTGNTILKQWATHAWQCWTVLPSAQEPIRASPVMSRSWAESIDALPRLMATVLLTIPWQPNG